MPWVNLASERGLMLAVAQSAYYVLALLQVRQQSRRVVVAAPSQLNTA